MHYHAAVAGCNNESISTAVHYSCYFFTISYNKSANMNVYLYDFSRFLYHPPWKLGNIMSVRDIMVALRPWEKRIYCFSQLLAALTTNRHGINHGDRMYPYAGIVVELFSTVLIACKAVAAGNVTYGLSFPVECPSYFFTLFYQRSSLLQNVCLIVFH